MATISTRLKELGITLPETNSAVEVDAIFEVEV